MKVTLDSEEIKAILIDYLLRDVNLYDRHYDKHWECRSFIPFDGLTFALTEDEKVEESMIQTVNKGLNPDLQTAQKIYSQEHYKDSVVSELTEEGKSLA